MRTIIGLLGLGVIFTAGCAPQSGSDNNDNSKPMSKEEARASAQRVSGSDLSACTDIGYLDTDGVTMVYAQVSGYDEDSDGLAVIPSSWSNIYEGQKYYCGFDGTPIGYIAITSMDQVGLDCLDTDPDVLDAEYTVYDDVDGDGHGDPATGSAVCGLSESDVTVGDDCDDTALTGAARYPGNTEACDNVDNDCNGYVDDGLENSWYSADDDGDTYGDPEDQIYACSMPSLGYVVDATDCDDTDGAVNPGMSEECNEIDDNCNDHVDEVFYPDPLSYADAMFDGAEASYSDEDEDTHPGTWYGFMCASQMAATGVFDYADDCDDGDGDTYPGAAALDSEWECMTDFDGDGFGDDNVGEGIVAGTDCDDGDLAINPDATEILDNATDEDCDGTADMTPTATDSDGDGDPDSTDCNDSNSAIYNGAPETCNGVDDDCDTSVDEGVTSTFYMDMDSDGYGDAAMSASACSASAGWVANATDCDDTDGAVNPGESETSFNGVDDNCDGLANTTATATIVVTPNSSQMTVPWELWIRDRTVDPNGNTTATWASGGAASGTGALTASVTLVDGDVEALNGPFNGGSYWAFMIGTTNVSTTITVNGYSFVVANTCWDGTYTCTTGGTDAWWTVDTL